MKTFAARGVTGIYALSLLVLLAMSDLSQPKEAAAKGKPVTEDSLVNRHVSPDYSGREDLARPMEILSVNYWIELTRDGKTSRATNKTDFHSGDQIAFHIRANAPSFVYMVYENTADKTHKVLFPDAAHHDDNQIDEKRENVLPSHDPIVFDEKPGMEKVLLIVSRTQQDADHLAQIYSGGEKKPTTAPPLIAMATNGSKDLVPDGIKIAYLDDFKPAAIHPTATSATTAASTTASTATSQSSKTKSESAVASVQKKVGNSSVRKTSTSKQTASHSSSSRYPVAEGVMNFTRPTDSTKLSSAQGVFVSESKKDGHEGLLPIEIAMRHVK